MSQLALALTIVRLAILRLQQKMCNAFIQATLTELRREIAHKTGTWAYVGSLKLGQWLFQREATACVPISTLLRLGTIISLGRISMRATLREQPRIILRTSRWATWKREKSMKRLLIDLNYPHSLLLINWM